MSLTSETTWAPSPTTDRTFATILSADPKGERIVYANSKSIFLRSIDDPAVSFHYTGHKTNTTVARFAPSGIKVASGDDSGLVRVWEPTEEGEARETLEKPVIAGRINDLAWDGDSQRIIAVGKGGSLGACFTADSGNTVGEISGHSKALNCVSIRQQRPLRAATAGDDLSVVFYHGAPFKLNANLQGQHSSFIYGTAFSPDGSAFVTVGADRKIWLYDGRTGEAKGQIGEGEHKGTIYGVSWAPDSKKFVTASADQTVKIWDAEAGKATQSWKMGEGDIRSIPDQQKGVVWPGRGGGLVISVDYDANLNYFAEGNAKPVKRVYSHQKSITKAAVSGSTLVTGGADGRVLAWDIPSGIASNIDGENHTNFISGITSSDEPTVQTVAWDDSLRSISLSAKTFLGDAIALKAQPQGVAVSGKTALVLTEDTIKLYTSGKPSGTVSLDFKATSIAATKSLIAVGSANKIIYIYSPESSTSLIDTGLQLRKSTGGISTLAFSPSGNLLAAGLTNGKILVYTVIDDLKTEWPLATDRWSAHTARVTDIAWDSKGERAVSSSLDTNIHLWSVKEPGKRIKVSNAHKDGVNGVAWAPGDEKVLSTGSDATVKVWKVGV